MAVWGLNEFEGDGGGAFYGVEVAAGGAETAFAAEGDLFEFAAVFAAVECATIGKIAAVEHFCDVFDDGGADCDTAV